MLRSILISASVLAVLVGGAFLALRLTSPDSQTVDAAELLAQAQTAGISPSPGSVLKITVESYHRGRGSVEPLQGGEPIAQIPNDTTTEIWLLIGDDPGTVVRRYLVERDPAGDVTQEEFFDGEREYLYSVPQGAVFALPNRSTPMTVDLQVDLEGLLRENTEALYVGERDFNGKRVHVLQIRQPVDAATNESLPEQGYVGIYAGDLNAVEFVTELLLDVDGLTLLQRVTTAVDAQGKETVLLSKTFSEIAMFSADQLPANHFQLHHVPPDVPVVEIQ